jgi:putative flippase GtrA
MRREPARAALRWAASGAALNAALYLAYMVLAEGPLGPRGAMTATYAAGIAAGYVVNRSWSFGHRGAIGGSLRRYLALYLGGYALNLAALTIAVDALGAPHALVQAAAIPALAVVFFLAQRHWVFAHDPGS